MTVLDTPVTDLGLPRRVSNTLRQEDVHTVGDLTQCSALDLLESVRVFGEVSLAQVRDALAGLGLALSEEAPTPFALRRRERDRDRDREWREWDRDRAREWREDRVPAALERIAATLESIAAALEKNVQQQPATEAIDLSRTVR